MKAILIFLFSLMTLMTSAQSGIYPEMVFVEGGTFTMGDSWGDGDADEQPEHQVTLSSFKISKTEVTVRQYKHYCQETGRNGPAKLPRWGWWDSDPMVLVSWHDAVAYCDWLSEKLDADYRLPTEAEWEYAARGGKHSKGTKYSGGRSIDLVGWYKENSDEHTHRIAAKLPNELGLYDMSGNVSEWCRDWYDEDYYANSPSTNPRGPSSGDLRVTRGGSIGSTSEKCRVSYRGNQSPEDSYTNIGFRVVLSQ